MIAISGLKFTLLKSNICLLVQVVGPSYCGLVNNTFGEKLAIKRAFICLTTVASFRVGFMFFTRSLVSTDLLWEEIILRMLGIQL